jgi:WD40 repeat protein
METGTETAISCAVLDSGEIYGKAENQVERISDTEEEQPALYYTYADHDAPLRSDGTRLIMRLKGGGLFSALPGSSADTWEWYPSEPVSSNILVSGDFLAAGSEDRSIYLLTKNTGDAVVRWETDFVPRALSFWNGILIVSDSAGNVSGYSLDQSGN